MRCTHEHSSTYQVRVGCCMGGVGTGGHQQLMGAWEYWWLGQLGCLTVAAAGVHGACHFDW